MLTLVTQLRQRVSGFSTEELAFPPLSTLCSLEGVIRHMWHLQGWGIMLHLVDGELSTYIILISAQETLLVFIYSFIKSLIDINMASWISVLHSAT